MNDNIINSGSILHDLVFNENKPAVKLILETDFTREIRILLKAGQEMKEHITPFPIVVEIVNGNINFGVNEKVLQLERGALISLVPGVPHNLLANEDSIVRLTLSKFDTASRVQSVSEI